MINEANKIIVKVGNKSNIMFSNSLAIRVLTMFELKSVINRYNDCHLLIIENIDKDEQNDIKEIITSFKAKDSKNEVLFYISDNDSCTSGIADELEYDIYLTDKDIYKAIYDKFGIIVSVYSDDKAEYNKHNNNIDDSTMSAFETIFDEVNNEDISDNNINEEVNTVKEIDVNKYNNVEEKQIIEEEPITTVDENNENSSVETNEIINNLNMQLRDVKSDYNELLKDMRDAATRISSLEEIVIAVTAEKQAIVDKYNSLVISDEILEDPISLAEYQKLEKHIEELESIIQGLNSNITELKEEVYNKDNTISNNNSTIVELQASNNELNKQLESLNDSIESGVAFENEKVKYEEKINELTENVSELKVAEEKALEKVREKVEEVNELNNRILSESSSREELSTKLASAIDKITELNKEIDNLKTENSNTESKLESVQFENDENKRVNKENLVKIQELEEKIRHTEFEANNTNNSALRSKQEYETKISSLEARLSVANQQLTQKEQQYNALVEKSGIDESGASALVETNKTLENITVTLREQLSASQKEVEQEKALRKNSDEKVSSLQNQVTMLQNNLKSIAAGSKASESLLLYNKVTIPTINYTGNAIIIPVFGSGSYGITTTAASLANKLSASSKTLYIDFDLVSPTADGFFRKNPIIAYDNNAEKDVTSTGLGIFYEKGATVFSQYFNKIAQPIMSTKGGGLYYLSGLYHTVSKDKIMSADYATMFNRIAQDFEYVVIDFGILTGSDIESAVIKAICAISYRAVAVTKNDPFGVRNFSSKVVHLDIEENRLIWLLNMVTTTNVDKRLISSYIKSSKYYMIPKVDEFSDNNGDYKDKLFSRLVITKKWFNTFADTLFDK